MDDLSARIREAREYLGFSTAQAAERLRCAPVLLEAIEAATADPGPEMLAKLGKLYMRPVEWFTGEWRFEPSSVLVCGTEDLTDGDREAILDFAEFLQCKKETETIRPVPCGMVGVLQDPDGRDYNTHCDQPGSVEVDGVLMCQDCADRVKGDSL